MNKKLAILLLVGIFAIGCLGTAYALHLESQYEYRGWEIATDAETVLPNRTAVPGINVELTQYGPDLDSHLEVIEQQGFHWIRQVFPWADMEPEQGDLDWAPWDAIVRSVAARPGLEMVAVLHTTPLWVNEAFAASTPTSPPGNLQTYETFVETFVERYGDSVDYYQIWDEPNLSSAWGDSPPNAAQYGSILEVAYTTIKAVDPTATVIAAALAPTVEMGPQNISDVQFLSDLYEFGASSYFDGIGAKPYGFSTGPNDRQVNHETLNFSRLILLREEMIRRGDADKPIWGSAFGWNSLPPAWAGSPSIWGEVNRETQLEHIAQAYRRATEEWPWCAGLILDSWQPAAEPSDPRWGFSLLPQGMAPEELELPLQLTPRSNARAAIPGRYPAVAPTYIDYTGEWEFGELGADIGYAQDSEFTIQFEGTDIALELRRDNYRGYLFVTVDGKPANELPQDKAGTSYIILNSSDNKPHVDLVPVATGLTNTAHTLHVRAEYGWDQWAIAGFRVAVAHNRDYRIPITLLSGLGSAALLLVIWVFPWSHTSQLRMALRSRIAFPIHVVLGITASVILMFGMALTWSESTPNLLRRDAPGLLIGIATSGILYFAEPFVVTIVAILVLWLLIYVRIELGLLLTILWVPFYLFPLTLYEFAIPVAEVCILLTTSAWLVQLAIKWAHQAKADNRAVWKPQLQVSAIDLGVLAIFLIATLSLTWAGQADVALREWRTTILEPILFYSIARTAIRDEQRILHLVDALIGAGLIAATISLIMYFSGEGVILAEGATRRLAGVYGSPNNVGLLMGRVLPFTVAYLIASTTPLRRAYGAISALLVLLAAVLSQSAGALLLGIPFSLFVMLFLWKRRYAIIAAGLAVLAGSVALVPLSQNPRFSRILDFSSGSTFFRLRIWESALRMIEARPLRGFGLDQFLYQYRGRYIFPDAWQEPGLSHPHNILLDFWTRLGFGGVVTLLWLQFHFWRTSLSVYSRSELTSGLIPLVNIAAMASMVDLLAHGMVDNSVFVIDLSFIFLFILLVPQQIALATFDVKPD